MIPDFSVLPMHVSISELPVILHIQLDAEFLIIVDHTGRDHLRASRLLLELEWSRSRTGDGGGDGEDPGAGEGGVDLVRRHPGGEREFLLELLASSGLLVSGAH